MALKNNAGSNCGLRQAIVKNTESTDVVAADKIIRVLGPRITKRR